MSVESRGERKSFTQCGKQVCLDALASSQSLQIMYISNNIWFENPRRLFSGPYTSIRDIADVNLGLVRPACEAERPGLGLWDWARWRLQHSDYSGTLSSLVNKNCVWRVRLKMTTVRWHWIEKEIYDNLSFQHLSDHFITRRPSFVNTLIICSLHVDRWTAR